MLCQQTTHCHNESQEPTLHGRNESQYSSLAKTKNITTDCLHSHADIQISQDEWPQLSYDFTPHDWLWNSGSQVCVLYKHPSIHSSIHHLPTLYMGYTRNRLPAHQEVNSNNFEVSWNFNPAPSLGSKGLRAFETVAIHTSFSLPTAKYKGLGTPSRQTLGPMYALVWVVCLWLSVETFSASSTRWSPLLREITLIGCSKRISARPEKWKWRGYCLPLLAQPVL